MYNAIVDYRYVGNEGAFFDGIRTYSCLTSALNDAPANATEPYVIFVRNGRYHEKLTIAKPFITLVGANRDETVLTFDAASGTIGPDGNPYGTSGSATVTIAAADFCAANLTIENGFDYPANTAKTAQDPTRLVHAQAVALRTMQPSDRACFRNVSFIGYQDTLYADADRHYFSRCTISGHIDFIFGGGRAVFDDCDIISRDRGSLTHNGYITAASTSISEPFGFLFVGCRLKKETRTLADGSVALGRPWHPTRTRPDGLRTADLQAVGSVLFKDCWMDSHISSSGWERMSGTNAAGNTIWFDPIDARFYEYGSTGPGAMRSDSRGVLDENQAKEYSITCVLEGWNPIKEYGKESHGVF